MSLNRGQIRDRIRTNLNDSGITYYSDKEINDSIQDAYNEIAARALYNVKNITLPWYAHLNYFDFPGPLFRVCDYIATIAIFNNSTRQFLRDDLNIRDFNRLRRDWETWRGAPQFWCPHSWQYDAIAPAYASVPSVNGTFILTYYAQSPLLAADADEFLIASDMLTLIEQYSTGDLLETAEEPAKAGSFWNDYESGIMNYKERCHKLAKYELLLRV